MKKQIAETIEGKAIIVDDGIAIRDMDRKQVKALREAGLDPAFVEMNGQKTADLIDWIIDHIYPDVELDGVPYYKITQLAMDTYRRAMSGPEAVKNS